ncbi:NADH-quinone oxidoreductase subunit J [Legionella sp. W05-934-2]|jgi:NADH-quinone oxidoreductase subunit J|uniref:NADH-quinone oxidoreductase subunit J n=1 Tax=Legionella sp. W05-934-2 TaxID=1198649 RepID=UPI003462FAA4
MHELFIQVVFYGFAALAVLSALMVITQNNPVRCVLFLVLTFFASAGLWIIAQAEFLALILVLVYVGAVMTLFLFVVMMLDIEVESLRGHFARYLPFGLILVALLAGLLMIALPSNTFDNSIVETSQAVTYLEPSNEGGTQEALSNTKRLGMVLYTEYLLPFEMAAMLLLVAIVAAITLAHTNRVRSKRQDIRQQLMTRREDRVRLMQIKNDNK